MQKNSEMILCGKKYFVVANIGQGSFGSVLKVLDEQKNEYALKVMSQQDENEENIMKKLNAAKPHRNIVNFIKSGKIEQPNLSKEENKLEYYYILMEYCDTDLYKQLQQKLVPQSDLRYIIVSIADGLSHLHLNNIIHRDLKPENVFIKILRINSTQTQNIYKLGDFGCSTEKSIAESQHVGTPYYMAPEIIKGEHYDSKVDIWALGTIVYELLTGQPLFNGPNVEQIFQLIEQQTDDSQYIKEKLKMLSDEYKPLVFKMLKVTPSLRPDINEVIRTLRNNGYKSPPRVQNYILPLPIKPLFNLKVSQGTTGYEANKQQNEKNIQTLQKFIPKINAEVPKSAREVPTNQPEGEQKKQPSQNLPTQIQTTHSKPLQQNQNQEAQQMQDQNKLQQNIQIGLQNQQEGLNNHKSNLEPVQKSQDPLFQHDSQIKRDGMTFYAPNQVSAYIRTEPIEENNFNQQQQILNNNSQIKNTNQRFQINIQNKPQFKIQINNTNHQAAQFHSPQGQKNKEPLYFKPNKK